ncbi:signal recognition particle subunit SRP68, putative [Plasmodium berghei]|uniref:Signal recognition particle subunit SRP68 n=2 Tax=Plasmodium berghei TaxID=5821 RepID=A0A509AP65_PLABA|nr:signal recognition particle subunit SRP68, putative [Plasmodium berghei ANKA]CXI63945.1 signal recognition particle subunit SRP68, putative [Plasmodium berghei]SCM23836.1 signal recognition particle subunit SRP68, putative [Plasmodium berghei]SCN26798.1 signal recognition particle subunit SRP68, putative [Plasmodium berghei]SCO61149.1 signal recognition particle subunit SRP68, putative [Plasmodium berghei]SCO63217.1 signal recognition particle subunit SRP68, putative [Plasmodium berghei]|eukprot:XP_034422415.1 signal recognition particle subunit SRP68, putative [Plasmodium berghei ANKA]
MEDRTLHQKIEMETNGPEKLRVDNIPENIPESCEEKIVDKMTIREPHTLLIIPEKKISFDIFCYLIGIYKKHGLYFEEMERFLKYVKRRRMKLRRNVLNKVKKVGNKYTSKIYDPDVINDKYFELLLLDVEICRAKYIKVKTDVNNLKAPYRSKYCYLRRLKKGLKKINFLINSISKVIDKNTELQIKCYHAYIEIAYLLEIKKYEECISKIIEFSKLVKLIKRITVNNITSNVNNTSIEYDKKNGEENLINLSENIIVEKSKLFLEEEKRINEIYEYFLSNINSYERICLYNIKKDNVKKSNEKLQEEDLEEKKDKITEIETYQNNENETLQIYCIDNTIIIKIKNKRYKLINDGTNDSILKIKNILDNDIKTVIEYDEIIKLNQNFNLNEEIKNKNFILIKFLDNYDLSFLINNYGNIFSLYNNCLSIVHEELVKSTHGDLTTNMNNKNSNNDTILMEKVWNNLENHLLCEKLYIDTERAIIVLMKNLYNVLNMNNNLKEFNFFNKKTLDDIVDKMPLLHSAYRYADMLRQNIDELKNIENIDIFINMLQIIKNVKSFSLACYYALKEKNAEAYALFDLVKSRNYIYINIDNSEYYNNKSLLRVSILFNRLQDILSILNNNFYFKHLAIFALQIKTKSIIKDRSLFNIDHTLFERKMKQIYLNPLHIDMAQIFIEPSLLAKNIQEEKKTSGLRSLIQSFWK